MSVDWTRRENTRAQIRVIIKRILRKYGYPPDKQEKAAPFLSIKQGQDKLRINLRRRIPFLQKNMAFYGLAIYLFFWVFWAF